MSENLFIEKSLPKEEKYILLLPQIENLISAEDSLISNLANFTAAIKQTFDDVSWVGFYLLKENILHLGPFQGKIACTQIKIGSGVCGNSASKKETIIVPDVDKFPGHIACDSESKSEIVIPVIQNENLIGVLDLDSTNYNTFDEIDKKYLEEFCNILVKKLNFEKIRI